MEEQKKGEVMAAFNRSLDVGLAKHAKEAAGEEQKEDEVAAVGPTIGGVLADFDASLDKGLARYGEESHL